MRLTDRCTVRYNGAYIGPENRPCEFRHTGGDKITERDRVARQELAVALVSADEAILAVPGLTGFTVEHHGRTYNVTAVLPRYITGGRLHHITLELEGFTG